MSDKKMQEVLSNHGVKDRYNWISDFVYGGIDGSVTTFAIVAGVEGASLSVSVILILGFANLVADGFSMSVSKYSSDKADLEQFEKIRQMEYQHIKEKPDHEREEIEEILAGYGFKGKDLASATKVITNNPDAWVDMMMRHEFNMASENVNPVKGAIATFVSFLVIGLVPLLAYLFKPLLNLSDDSTFVITSFATLVALFIVGAVKSRFTERNWFLSGLETAAYGGIAAAIAYGIGFGLKGLLE